MIIILSTTLTVRYTASYDSDDDGLRYAPTDTRIISVNRILCGTVNFQVGIASDIGYEVYLYSLVSPPQLTGDESFNQQPSLSDYTTYSSFMPKGSNFSMLACLLTNQQPYFTFYAIKGTQNYKNWEYDLGSIYDTLMIETSCEAGNDTYSYSVTDDDFFYLVFKTGDFDSFSYNDINITVNFHGRHYEIGNDTILDSCSLDSQDFYSTCSVELPLSGSTTLLEVVPNNDSNILLSDSVTVNAFCGPRIWMYVLISLVILVVIVGFFVALTVCLYCVCIRRRRKVAAANTGVGTEQSVNTPLLYDAAAGQAPTTDVVYPQNSVYSSYGSNYHAPPTYKE